MEIRYLNFDMKRFYLFIALLATSMSGFAQDVEIDETDLFGRWIQVSKSGEFTSYKKYDNAPDYSRQTPETLLFYDEPNIKVNDDSLGVAYYCDKNYPIRKYNEQTGEFGFTGEYGEYWLYAGMRDYFISKNNILHIYLWGTHYALRYKILSFDGSTMTLETMNGKGTIAFAKDQPSEVRAITNDKNEVETYYSIDGMKLNSEPRTGVFIKNKRKYIK